MSQIDLGNHTLVSHSHLAAALADPKTKARVLAALDMTSAAREQHAADLDRHAVVHADAVLQKAASVIRHLSVSDIVVLKKALA